MIKAPENVCINGNCISWSPVLCADGYNIHIDGEYSSTVEGINKVSIDAPGQYSVSAWARDKDGVTVHSPRTDAKSLVEMLNPSNNGLPESLRDQYQTIVFEDQFNAPQLDVTKWNTRQFWGPDVITNNEDQRYLDVLNGEDSENNPFSHTGEHLKITASQATGENNGQPYVSGVITTDTKHLFTPGCFIDIRLKAPCDAVGSWIAAWLYSRDQDRPEIDIVEIINGTDIFGTVHKPNEAWQAVHNDSGQFSLDHNRLVGGEASNCDGSKTYDANTGLALPTFKCDDFNNFGIHWDAGKIVWYVNGQPTNSLCDGRVPRRLPNHQMYLAINFAVGGTLGGKLTSGYPADLLVDYVKVYR